MTKQSTAERRDHGHMDEDEIPDATNVILHWHEKGDRPHRHTYLMIGGPRPDMRWVSPANVASMEYLDD